MRKYIKTKRKFKILSGIFILMIITLAIFSFSNYKMINLTKIDKEEIQAATTSRDGSWEYTLNDDGTIRVDKYKGTDTNVIIPSIIDGYTVTTLNNMFWGYNRDDFTADAISVTVPSTVSNVMAGNMWNPESKIKSISVSPDNQYYSSEDGVLFNKNKTELVRYPEKKEGTTYKIPSSVTRIGSFAFYFTNLASIEISSSVTEIDSNAFSNCANLANIEIQSSVTKIDSNAFSSCVNLKSISVSLNNQYYSSENGVLFNKDKTQLLLYPSKKEGIAYKIPSSVTEIESYSFQDCTNLTNIEIPSGVTYIDVGTFSNCANLTNIEIPLGVTMIKNSAFWGCTKLTSMIIPSSVTSIEQYAFKNCTNLTSIEIPSSVTHIDKDAFDNCENLTIKCPENSEAHKYAINNAINFEFTSRHIISIGVAAGTQTEFIQGQILYGELNLIVQYSDASIAVATTFGSSDITITDFDSSKLGKQTITITYKGEASTTLDITLIEKTLIGIEIASNPTKTSYTKDDTEIDLTGGKITLTYNDGTKEQKDMTAQGVTAKMIDNTTLGKKEVEITYSGKTVKFEVEVIQKIEYTNNNNNGITITGKGEEENKEIIIPDKINGKPVTEIGDKAFANREDLISVKIPDSVTKIADNAFEGSTNVTIICNSGSKAEEFAKNKDMNYILEDKTVESISIKTLPTKINYNKGEDLDITGGRILLTYTDKTTSPISMKFTGVTITGYDKTKLGEQQLIVTFREKTTNFDVIVNTESTRKYGDVNGDGRVNAKDLLLLQGHILAEMPGGNTDRLLEGDNFTAGDMDSNGKINAKDLLLLQREILKNM